MTTTMFPNKYLVLGGTGATGKHVVNQLLHQGHHVRVIVRSKPLFFDLLHQEQEEKKDTSQLLDVAEDSLSGLTDQQIRQHVHDVDAVIMCLGHNISFKGIFGHPRRLVTDVARRFTTAMIQQSHQETGYEGKENKEMTTNGKNQKFILMGSEGVASPAGTDDKRTFIERCILFLLRWLIPPHADNEDAAAYLHTDVGGLTEWVVVRPTNLVSLDNTKAKDLPEFEIFDKPQGRLFGSGVVTRANVARFMVSLVTSEKAWERYKFRMPVIWDKLSQAKAKAD